MLKMYTYTSTALYSVKHGIGNFIGGQVQKVKDDESGATAIEYGLIAAGIAVAIIGIVFTLGNDISAFFVAVDSKLSARTPT
jgi:pilus assembly protein Flp/PilA